jgi:flagellar hook-associated protein 1 FlgK
VSNLFNTINIGLKSLQAQKKSLNTVSHNIANANTEGYSRQRAIQKTTDPYTVPGMTMPEGAGQVGTGVEVAEIERVRNSFIDGQINSKKQDQGFWQKKSEGLHRIELIFNEPSDKSLASNIDKFWSSLEELSNNPEDKAVRTTVKERALTLVDNFHSMHKQLSDYKRSLNGDVKTTVNEINSDAQRIADLNAQIAHIKGAGKNPNDLMDKRDLLFEKLNKKVNVQGHNDKRGNLNVSLGGVGLVKNDSLHKLKTEPTAEDYEDKVVFEETRNEANISGGSLKGLIDLRDEELSSDKDGDGYIARLNELANTFKKEFNDIHQDGYTLNGASGGDFFVDDRTTAQEKGAAMHLQVAKDIKSNINNIAAGRFYGDYSNDSSVMTAEVTDIDSIDIGANYKVDVDETAGTYTIEDTATGTLIADGEPYTGSGQIVDETTSIGLEFTLNGNGTASAEMDPAPGNGYNAMEMADVLKTDNLFNDKSSTMLDQYKSMVSTVGVEGQRANQMVGNNEVLIGQLENQRKSISGVSLDEEMGNMVKYQQAYNAAAKLISNANRMMDSLMGILR